VVLFRICEHHILIICYLVWKGDIKFVVCRGCSNNIICCFKSTFTHYIINRFNVRSYNIVLFSLVNWTPIVNISSAISLSHNSSSHSSYDSFSFRVFNISKPYVNISSNTAKSIIYLNFNNSWYLYILSSISSI